MFLRILAVYNLRTVLTKNLSVTVTACSVQQASLYFLEASYVLGSLLRLIF